MSRNKTDYSSNWDAAEEVYSNVEDFPKNGSRYRSNGKPPPVDDPDDEALFARIKSFAAITAQPAHVIPWDIPSLLPSDESPALAFGPPSATKSWHLKHVVDCMASGDDFLGRFPVRKRDSALYINIDAGEKSFENRVQRISNTENAYAISLRGSHFNLAVLRKLLKRFEHGFVVIDSLPAFFIPRPDADPAGAMRNFLEAVQEDYAEFDCGGILADHPHRPKERGTLADYYGNIQKEATIRCMWSISATKTPGSKQVHATITCRKMNEGTDFAPVHSIVDFSAKIVTFKAIDSGEAPTTAQNPDLEKRMIEWAGQRKETFTCSTAEKEIRGYRHDSIRDTFWDLVSRGIFVEAGRRGSGVTYRLASTPPSDDELPL
jgi:hypothetical protein